jgi:hypothetical protein
MGIMDTIKRNHARIGGLFWDPQTVAWWDIRTCPKLWPVPGGWLFVTGQYYPGLSDKKRWSVRFADRNGLVASVSPEGSFARQGSAYHQADVLQARLISNPEKLDDTLDHATRKPLSRSRSQVRPGDSIPRRSQKDRVKNERLGGDDLSDALLDSFGWGEEL